MNERNKIQFHKKLLNYIKCHYKSLAKSMLNAELAQASNDFGTLLHYSASYNGREITRYLIAIESDVNSLGQDDRTPLMLAVKNGRSDDVEILLEADANIDVIDATGKSPFQAVFEREISDDNIIIAFTRKLKFENRTNKELAERFITSGCNMYHTAVLKDVDLMKCMLDRTIDVDSRSSSERTALHVAANQGDLKMTIWLLNNGADENAVDAEGKSALLISVSKGNRYLVKILLERGADPYCRDRIIGYTPLFPVYMNTEIEEDFVKCAEILFQHGVIPEDLIINDCTTFDFALCWSSDRRIKTLIGYLAMLEMLGMSITKSIMYVVDELFQPKIQEFEIFHEQCLRILKILFFENLSLFDLLQVKEHKIRLLVRKGTFLSDVEKACSENKLKKLFSYYYNTVTKRVAEASRVVKLEDKGIEVICKLFKGYYNQCYDFVNQVVGYLNESDREQLIQVI